MAKEYGDFEQVNGGVVNDLNEEIKTLTAKLEKSKSNVKTLMKYVGKIMKNKRSDIDNLLNIQGENLIDVLIVKRNSVYEELSLLDDGEYIARNELLHDLDGVIERLRTEAHKANENGEKNG